MRNIDYYGTKLFLKSMEIGGCVTGLVHEAKNKEDHYCSYHNSNCELCKKEAKEWLNEPFNRITEKERQFLSVLNKKIKEIKIEKNGLITLWDDKRENWWKVEVEAFFDERPFKPAKIGEYLEIEKLLKLEVA